jgi:mono/diheme cytochrome c family protein
MQPALTGSEIVSGDLTRLIEIMLRGPAAVLPSDRTKYSNVMPAFGVLNNTQIADLLTYVRRAFGQNTSPVTAAHVAVVRGE